ncbi:MAG: hypothetical protein ACRDHZ_01505 [Ktedonobacteraceae bacterium]
MAYGALTEKERAVANPHVEAREDKPEDIFLEPSQRKYPVKVKRNGRWHYDRDLLLAAERDAIMHHRRDLADRAKAIREREFGAGGREAHDDLTAALKRRYATPAEAMRALGLDQRLLTGATGMALDRHYDERERYDGRFDRNFDRHYDGRFGELSDDDRGRLLKDSLRRLADDAQEDPDELVNLVFETLCDYAPAEVGRFTREMGNGGVEDGRSNPTRWARDRRELRRARDASMRRARSVRRLGDDEPYPRGEREAEFEPDRSHTGEDRRRARAHDMAYDSAGSSNLNTFARIFGDQAANIDHR